MSHVFCFKPTKVAKAIIKIHQLESVVGKNSIVDDFSTEEDGLSETDLSGPSSFF